MCEGGRYFLLLANIIFAIRKLFATANIIFTTRKFFATRTYFVASISDDDFVSEARLMILRLKAIPLLRG